MSMLKAKGTLQSFEAMGIQLSPIGLELLTSTHSLTKLSLCGVTQVTDETVDMVCAVLFRKYIYDIPSVLATGNIPPGQNSQHFNYDFFPVAHDFSLRCVCTSYSFVMHLLSLTPSHSSQGPLVRDYRVSTSQTAR